MQLCQKWWTKLYSHMQDCFLFLSSIAYLLPVTNVCTHACIYSRTHACMHTHAHTHTQARTYTGTHIHTHTHTGTHTCTHTCMHLHTHIHTHTQKYCDLVIKLVSELMPVNWMRNCTRTVIIKYSLFCVLLVASNMYSFLSLSCCWLWRDLVSLRVCCSFILFLLQKMWLERTNLTTAYPLPGIVGWYPVVATECVSTVTLLVPLKITPSFIPGGGGGVFCSPYLGKATAAARAALPIHSYQYVQYLPVSNDTVLVLKIFNLHTDVDA